MAINRHHYSCDWVRISKRLIIRILEWCPIPASSLDTVRIFRVMRPLKTFPLIDSKPIDNISVGCKKLIKSLIMALPEFANVGIFLIFVFMLFASMGL